MIAEIHKYLTKNNKTISTCESITAGAISSKLIEYPGSSFFFKGSLVVYNDEVKSKDIREQILKNSPEDNEDFFVVPKVVE